MNHERLRAQLVEWRRAKAAATRRPEAAVLEGPTLEDIIRARPLTKDALAKCRGMDFRRVRDWGDEIVGICQGNLRDKLEAKVVVEKTYVS